VTLSNFNREGKGKMRKYQVIVLIAIFIAGFITSMVLDGNHLVSITRPALAEPQIISRQPSQRQYWEYRVISRTNSNQNLEPELAKLGDQGFEVFSVNQTESGQGFVLTIMLRRLKY
jgi:hypothetical protein